MTIGLIYAMRGEIESLLNTENAEPLQSAAGVEFYVLAEAFLQHDVDTTAVGDPAGLVSTVNRTEFPTSDLEKAKAAMDKTGFAYRTGLVATGDWFATDTPRAHWISDTFHPLLCDMEGGADAQVCLRNGVPFMSIKSVSDCLFVHDDFFFNFPTAMKDLNRVAMAFIDALEAL